MSSSSLQATKSKSGVQLPNPTCGGLRLTVVAQSLLLVISGLFFLYSIFWVPQFPEGGIFGDRATVMILAMAPNMLLLAWVLLELRCTPVVGLVFALVVFTLGATKTVPWLFWGSSGIAFWGVSILGLAIAAVRSKEDTLFTLNALVEPFRHGITYALLFFTGFVTTPFLILPLMLSGFGDQNPDGFAPDADYNARRAWGQKEMRQYFEHVDRWVRKSDLITSDVGKVTGVAPIGWPNKVVTFFTDGPSVSMNLEVVGELGEGTLTLPEVQLPGYVKKDIKVPFGIHEESNWNFQGNSSAIASSGESWVQKMGLEEQHGQIVAEAKAGNHRRVIEACRNFEELLPSSLANENRKSWELKLRCGMFLAMPESDRRSLLLLLGDSHAAIGNVNDARSCYFDAARILFHALNFSYWSRGSLSDCVDPTLLTNTLEDANEALEKARQLDPENKALKKLARHRALLAYQHRNGHLRDKPWGLSDDQKRERYVAELRDLYVVAVKLAKESPWLRQELGRMRFRPELNSAWKKRNNLNAIDLYARIKNPGNKIEINESDRYRARVVLEVTGSSGKSGSFSLNVSEAEELSKPIDLYASVPRYPQVSYSGNSLTWQPDGGKPIRLDSKTLMPRKKKETNKSISKN